MKRRIPALAAAILFLGAFVLASACAASAQSMPFAVASVHFEQNATDGDVEVVFEVKGGDEGLAKLTVISPDGRAVIDFTAPEASTLGIRQFRFESPEPGDVEDLKAAYPEGIYTFAGVMHNGDKLHGTSTLHHKLPATGTFLQPAAGALNVDARKPVITWKSIANLAAYIIEIEQDELNVNITAKLPASVSSFAVPEGFLRPGIEYQLSIGTVTDDGNISFVETTFATIGEMKK